VKKWQLTLSALTASAMLLVGCSSADNNQEQAASDGKIKVVASFYPMYEFTKQIAGEHADVSVLVPSGTEPHDWEPTAKDVAEISKARLFVYNGAGFETWVDAVLDSAKNDNLTVVEATKGLELLKGSQHEHEHEGAHEGEHKDDAHADEHGHEADKNATDPHVWLDPLLVQEEVKAIADALIKADPAHADAYKQNLAAYLSKLQALDQEFQALKNAKRKEFVTAHTAFAYLANRYGLEQIAISGLSPEQEPTATEMQEVVEEAKKHNVKTIFFETLVSPKVAEAVAREVGAKTDVLNPLEGLTEEEQQQGLDYISVMKKNLQALQTELNS